MSEASTRLVLGIQPVREAIAVHGAKLRVLVERRAREAEQMEAIARFANDRGAKVERVERSVLDRIAKGDRHQGVIAEAPPLTFVEPSALADGEADWPPLVVALDELTDPHNFGAIVRSAVALGATAIAWPEDRSAPLSTTMVRSSAGAVEHARLCRVASLPRLLQELSEKGLGVIGLDASATHFLDEDDLRAPTCLVVGSEGKGLRRATKQACGAIARLPMRGAIGSLNASNAAAIALYEALRQRRAK